MTCEHVYVDGPEGCIGFVEIDGKGQMVRIDSIAECRKCGDTRMSIRMEDGTMWLDLGNAE